MSVILKVLEDQVKRAAWWYVYRDSSAVSRNARQVVSGVRSVMFMTCSWPWKWHDGFLPQPGITVGSQLL